MGAGWLRSGAVRRWRKNAPKTANKPNRWSGINELNKKTNRKQSQFKAPKSFRSDMRSENKANLRPLSPLDRWCPKNQTQSNRPGCHLRPTTPHGPRGSAGASPRLTCMALRSLLPSPRAGRGAGGGLSRTSLGPTSLVQRLSI